MFRNLRIKLTLINVVVVAAITLFFMTGVYILMARSLTLQSDQLMRLIATEAGSNTTINMTRREKHWFIYFYVKTDNTGKITEKSPNLPVSNEQLQLLVNKTIAIEKQAGRVKWFDDYDFRFVKAALNNGNGSAIVFMNAEQQEEIIGHLLGAFTVAGLGGLILTLFGSLFMANKALIPIKKSWERQKNFVADASHELRTPLAVIQTNLDVIKNSPEEKVGNQMTWLENIETENKLMAKLVDDLLFLARADSNQLLMNMANFNLNTAITEALSPFRPVADRENKKLLQEMADEIVFYGDQIRIKQLIGILVDNAIKYTPEGGIVSLNLHESSHDVIISVEDTGEGIEKENLDKIFERFYRIDKARSRENGGTGLGLAIADWIAKEHRGSIKADSTPGIGTTFTVTLPKIKPDKNLLSGYVKP